MKIIKCLFICLVSTNFHAYADSGNFKSTRYPFLPVVESGQDNPVCKVVRNFYEQQFLGDDFRLSWADTNRFQMNNIDPVYKGMNWVQWDILGDENATQAVYRPTSRKNDFLKKLLYTRSVHSWRGNIHQLHLLDEKEMNSLENKIRAGERINFDTFKSRNDLSQKASLNEWAANNVFESNGKYFVINETGELSDLEGKRTVYELGADIGATPVCTIRVMDVTLLNRPELASVRTVKESMRFIAGTETVYCGTLNADHRAKLSAQEAAQRLVNRPWLIDEQRGAPLGENEAESVFLSDWALSDIWNERELYIYYSAKQRAIPDLAAYYQKEFGIDKAQALSLAKTNLTKLLAANITIPSSYNEFRNADAFEHLKRLSSGGSISVLDVFNRHKEKALAQPQKMAYITMALDDFDNLQEVSKDSLLVQQKNAFGKTALMYAAHMNLFESASGLLRETESIEDQTTRDANPIDCDDGPEIVGRTALMYAAENASLELIELLLNAGAKTDVKDSAGRTVTHYLAQNPRLNGLAVKTLDDLHKTFTSEAYKASRFSASFDCQRASTPIEKQICADKSLAIYDREIGKAYSAIVQFSSNAEREKADQRYWLKERRNGCLSNDLNRMNVCLKKELRARERYLLRRLEETQGRGISQ